MSHRVKVRFRLDRDAEGWPPVEREGVWAKPAGAEQYELDNVPLDLRRMTGPVLYHPAPDTGQIRSGLQIHELENGRSKCGNGGKLPSLGPGPVTCVSCDRIRRSGH